MTETRTEPLVAKIQKTLTFHDEVARLIQAYADKKGTTFQRVVQAAALQFFFSSTDGPDESWISTFVELEKGTSDPPLDLAGLPIKYYVDQAEIRERKLESYKRRHPDAGEDRYVRTMQQAIDWLRSEAGCWRSGIADYGGGVDAVIDYAIESYDEKDASLRLEERLNKDADDE